MKVVVSLALACVAGIASAQESKFNIGECYTAVWLDPKAALVAKRIGVGQSPIPLELRASKLKANAKEKASLEFLAAGLSECQKQDQPSRAAYHPLFAQAISEFEARNRNDLAKAYAGDLTWGGLIAAIDSSASQFEARINELKAMAQASAQAEQEKKAAQAVADAQAEEARKAALRADYERMQAQQAQAERARKANEQQQFMNSLMLLEAARPKPAPMMPLMNNNISCTSQNLNGTVHTNCR